METIPKWSSDNYDWSTPPTLSELYPPEVTWMVARRDSSWPFPIRLWIWPPILVRWESLYWSDVLPLAAFIYFVNLFVTVFPAFEESPGSTYIYTKLSLSHFIIHTTRVSLIVSYLLEPLESVSLFVRRPLTEKPIGTKIQAGDERLFTAGLIFFFTIKFRCHSVWERTSCFLWHLQWGSYVQLIRYTPHFCSVCTWPTNAPSHCSSQLPFFVCPPVVTVYRAMLNSRITIGRLWNRLRLSMRKPSVHFRQSGHTDL